MSQQVNIFLDIEGTLVDSISSWVDLHNAFGTREQADQFYLAWLTHRDAHRWAKSDITLWQDKTEEDIFEVLDKIQYLPNAVEGVEELKQYANVYLITGGFGIFVERIAEELEFERENLIYHRIYRDGDKWVVDDDRSFHNKSVIKDFEGYNIAVGNGQNDIDMFNVANIAIGFNLDPKKRDKIVPYIDFEVEDNDFSEVVEIIKAVIGEF